MLTPPPPQPPAPPVSLTTVSHSPARVLVVFCAAVSAVNAILFLFVFLRRCSLLRPLPQPRVVLPLSSTFPSLLRPSFPHWVRSASERGRGFTEPRDSRHFEIKKQTNTINTLFYPPTPPSPPCSPPSSLITAEICGDHGNRRHRT